MSTPGITNNPNGRPAGKANKRNQEVWEEAEKEGVSPPKLLIAILSGKKDNLAGEAINKEDIKWAINILIQYTHGKRKPVDSEGNDSTDPLSDLIDEIRSRR